MCYCETNTEILITLVYADQLILVFNCDSEFLQIHPLIADPDIQQRFLISWNVPENFVVVVTLFRSSRHLGFEPKEWTFTIYEDEVPLAVQTLNLSDFVDCSPNQIEVDLPFRSMRKHVRTANLHFTISCAFVKQGKASYESGQYVEDCELNPGIEGCPREEKWQASLISSSITKPYTENSNATATKTLIDWCLRVTKGYPKVKIQDMTTSWRNGVAFCAILHHYRPDLIEFDSLDPSDTCGNCKIAFEIGEKLGIPRVIEPSDMIALPVPDKLSIMTYLFQLKSYFTNYARDGEMVSFSGNGNSTQSKLDHFQTDNRSPLHSKTCSALTNLEKNYRPGINVFQLPHTSTLLQMFSSPFLKNNHPEYLANTISGDLEHGCLSPPKIFQTSHQRKEIGELLMTRKQFLNPFDSDDEDFSGNVEQGVAEMTSSNTSDNFFLHQTSASNSSVMQHKLQNTSADVVSDLRLCGSGPPKSNRERSRSEELKQEAKQRLAGILCSDFYMEQHFSISDLEKHKLLHERARQLIAEAKASKPMTEIIGVRRLFPQSLKGSLRQYPDDTSHILEPNCNFDFTDVSDVHDSVNNEIFARINENPKTSYILCQDVATKAWRQAFTLELLDRRNVNRSQYVTSEMNDLNRERVELDEKAALLEWELRRIMKFGMAKELEEEKLQTEELEEEKLQEWFDLVNKKNALIHRQMQLDLLEKEHNLERRFNMLSVELRKIMSEPDSLKTDEVHFRETLLLAELMELVDKRDESIQRIDSQAKASEDDEKAKALVEQKLSIKMIHRKEQDAEKSLNNSYHGSSGCVLQ